MFPLRPDEAEPPDPEFDPDLEDNPEVVEALKQMPKRSKEMTMREAKSEEHLFTHRRKESVLRNMCTSKDASASSLSDMDLPQWMQRHLEIM